MLNDNYFIFCRVKHKIFCSLQLRDINSVFFSGILIPPSLLQGKKEEGRGNQIL